MTWHPCWSAIVIRLCHLICSPYIVVFFQINSMSHLLCICIIPVECIPDSAKSSKGTKGQSGNAWAIFWKCRHIQYGGLLKSHQGSLDLHTRMYSYLHFKCSFWLFNILLLSCSPSAVCVSVEVMWFLLINLFLKSLRR